ncbi:MAG: phage portal protein, partial [Gammaproteobacteria bacterium]
YQDGYRDREPVVFTVDEVGHFAPHPDPLSPWRGMSWLTPILREVIADKQATVHKQKFFENGATPNMVVKLPETMGVEAFKKFRKLADSQHQGAGNAYRTMYVGGGADVTVVGKDFKQIDFKATQGAGETRIAADSGIHPVIIGLSEGLGGSSLNQGNFNAARRLTADKCLRPLWRNAAATLEQIVAPPRGAELWYDERDVAFLRDDQRDIAEIQEKQAGALRSLTDAGFDPDASVRFLLADDLSALLGQHSGLFSVQLQPPGAAESDPAVRVEVRTAVELTELLSKGWQPVHRQTLQLEAA